MKKSLAGVPARSPRRARKLLVAAVAWGGLACTVPAPASAESPMHPVANGRHCGIQSVSDPNAGHTRVGQINGGPIAVGTGYAPGTTISITCSIHVGSANVTHAGADAATATSAAMPGVATLPPTTITYEAPEPEPVFLCTEISIGGDVWYWDDTIVAEGTEPIFGTDRDQLDVRRGWVTDAAAVCQNTVIYGPGPEPLFPILVDTTIRTACEVSKILAPGVDPLIVIGPDGDLYVAGFRTHDCEPSWNPLPGPFFPDQVLCPARVGYRDGPPRHEEIRHGRGRHRRHRPLADRARVQGLAHRRPP
jgi:hypothetical protein